MAKIFISYRRDDSGWQADALYKAIRPHLSDPDEEIFIDVDNIPLGVNFRTYLDQRVSQCEYFLALIGKDWLTAKNDQGQLRLEDPSDFVRLEIASALKRGIPVIPVLLDGAPVPRKEQLPNEIQELSERNGVEVRRTSFEGDSLKLLRGLGLLQKQDETSPKPPISPSPVKRQVITFREVESKSQSLTDTVSVGVKSGGATPPQMAFETTLDQDGKTTGSFGRITQAIGIPAAVIGGAIAIVSFSGGLSNVGMSSDASTRKALISSCLSDGSTDELTCTCMADEAIENLDSKIIRILIDAASAEDEDAYMMTKMGELSPEEMTNFMTVMMGAATKCGSET